MADLPSILRRLRAWSAAVEGATTEIKRLRAEIKRLAGENASLRDRLEAAMIIVRDVAGPLPWRTDPLEHTPIVRGYQPKPKETTDV